MADIIDAVNQRAMRNTSTVHNYARHDTLTRAERASINEVADQARGRPILDIGVGGGRTVPALTQLSANYLGVDYSPEMVEVCKRRFPQVRFALADARRLTELPDRSIHLVMFSCNGLGMVSHADRLQILREVYRVLEPGGVFLFSTHNQNCSDHDRGFRFPHFEFSANPARLGMRALRFVGETALSVYNRMRLARHDLRTPDYSIINDYCHHYSVMLYYITLANQRRQLEAAGFQPGARAFDLNGQEITTDSTLNSIALIARK